MKTFVEYLALKEHIGDFAAAGERARKKAGTARPGQLHDEIHKHIENLIAAAREEGRNYGSTKHQDATDQHHDRLVGIIQKHMFKNRG